MTDQDALNRIAALPAQGVNAATREAALREAAKALLPDDDMTWRGSWYEPALRAGQARILALIGEKP